MKNNEQLKWGGATSLYLENENKNLKEENEVIDISDKVNLLSGHTLSDIIATKYKNHIHIEIAMQLDTHASAKFIAQVADDISPNGKVAISSLCATNEHNVISSAYIGADGKIFFVASENILYAYVTADYITKGG